MATGDRRWCSTRSLEERGVDFFRVVCDMDLEDLAKLKRGLYTPEGPLERRRTSISVSGSPEGLLAGPISAKPEAGYL